ncbi:MAG: hypothetical protein NTX29_17490 [Actinobacteria bacterium]|nr:hypothetical protein [Actinomycetota bacterium]
MTPAIDHRVAAGIVEDALTSVFDPAIVRGLREDSPLAGVGMMPADAVCIADAVAVAAERAGLVCHLDDADFATAESVADLVRAVETAARPEALR